MNPVKHNSYWEALLEGRRFEVQVPLDLETCTARLEKQAAATSRFGLRFSKVKAGLCEWALLVGAGWVETVGRGRLEDTGDGHTLFSGHIGTNTYITNGIISIFALVGLLFIWSNSDTVGEGLALSAVLVTCVALVLAGRLRTFEHWLRWLLEGLEPRQD